ncbi:MAG: ferredoxin [Moritella sp.]|jgi:ferredoxin
MCIEITTNSGSYPVEPQDNSLLDTLERTGHQVEYQCRQGYCGACRIPLLSGTVSYQTEPLAAITPGSILPCCCLAEGDIRLGLEIMNKQQ